MSVNPPYPLYERGTYTPHSYLSLKGREDWCDVAATLRVAPDIFLLILPGANPIISVGVELLQ